MNAYISHSRPKSNNSNTDLLYFRHKVCTKTDFSVIASNLLISKSEDFCSFLTLGDYFVVSNTESHSLGEKQSLASSMPLSPAFLTLLLLVSCYWFLLLCLYFNTDFWSWNTCQTTDSILALFSTSRLSEKRKSFLHKYTKSPLKFHMKVIFLALLN